MDAFVDFNKTSIGFHKKTSVQRTLAVTLSQLMSTTNAHKNHIDQSYVVIERALHVCKGLSLSESWKMSWVLIPTHKPDEDKDIVSVNLDYDVNL